MVCWFYKRIDVTRCEEVENMKQKNMFVLDEKDDKAVQTFRELGMPKNLAKTLMYISQVDECRSAEVEQAADLRQPEVCVAMQELRRRGWVKKRDLNKKGKGRPVHIYTPTKNLSEIWKAFEQEKLKEVETIKNDISELKNLIKSR
jgi:predicted transcriptional regulator